MVIIVSDISDIKVMSSTVAVIFAIVWVANNSNFWTEPNSFQTESEFFKNLNRKRTKVKTSIPHIPTSDPTSVCPASIGMHSENWG